MSQRNSLIISKETLRLEELVKHKGHFVMLYINLLAKYSNDEFEWA